MPRWTNFPNGITSLGIPTFGAGGLIPYTGNYWFVQELYGTATSGGNGSASAPFGTLTQALTAATPGNNDVIFITGTVHVSASVLWNINDTHLIGLCAPLKRGKRARISVTGATPFSYLMNVSGNGCQFANIQVFYGFPTTGATTPIAWLDTGGRNSYNNVEFLGFGDATVTTGTANQTGARAMKINNSVGETTFSGCVFGADTLQRNATNYTLEIAGGAPRITIEDCDFEADIGSSGTAGSHLLVGAAGIDRYLLLKRNRFMAAIKSGSSTMAQAFNVSGSAGGVVLMDQSEAFGITAWETSPSNSVYTNMSAVSAPGGGISLVL